MVIISIGGNVIIHCRIQILQFKQIIRSQFVPIDEEIMRKICNRSVFCSYYIIFVFEFSYFHFVKIDKTSGLIFQRFAQWIGRAIIEEKNAPFPTNTLSTEFPILQNALPT